MTSSKDELLGRLTRYRQVTITVIGRKSGKKISRPVWFVLEDKLLYLLPVEGSDTQWYKNVLKNPWIRVEAGAEGADFKATPATGKKAVESVVEKFRERYGTGDVTMYYSKFDVAVLIKLG